MRKIDTQAAAAFKYGKPFNQGNTTITIEGGAVTMRLHGHIIAKMLGNTLVLTLAGYNTRTTRARLNGILYALNMVYSCGYCQKDFAAVFWQGKEDHHISAASWQHFTRENTSAPWIYKD